MKKIYFKGLTEIRAVAALFVIFHHIELYKHRDGFTSLYDTILVYFIRNLGKNGVYIFFVLSGFLITYLLLSEKEFKGKISIKKFYLRRILRIWPLYYLIVLLSFTLVPLLANNFTAFQNEAHYYKLILRLQEAPYITLLLFVLFLPNFALAYRPAVVGASQSWSVGVEEQFYIIWPHIINNITNKKILFLLFSAVGLIELLPQVISPFNYNLSKAVGDVIHLIPIHFMAVGAIGALGLYYYKKLTDRVFKNKYLFILNTALLLILLSVNIDIPLKNLTFSFIVMLEILFIIQEGFKINLRNKHLEKIGDISYGVYMYHPLAMFICFPLFNSVFPIESAPMYNISIYGSIVISTLIVSRLSFNYFESKFIALKNKKFTIIKSGKSISEKTS